MRMSTALRSSSRLVLPTFLVLAVWLFHPRPAAAQSWPMFQGNPAHTGYVPVSLEPQWFHVRWTRNLGTIPNFTLPVNPVAAGDGRVYATLLTRFNDVPQLFALRTSDGATLWTKGFGAVFSVNPPSYVNGRVYVQTGNSSDTWLWAFDGSSGTTIFQSPHGAQWERYFSPTVSNGRVYVNGGEYGGMYAFSALNGDQFWYADLPQYHEWTPAVDGTSAYAYVGSYAPGLYIKNLLDGTASTPGFIPDPDFEWDDWSMNLAPVLGAYGVLAIHNGRLISFNTMAGTIGWQLSEGFTGQPSVAKGRIYAANNGGLSVYDESSHTLVWSWTPPPAEPKQAITQPMIVTDTHVLVSTRDTVYAIDLTTHEAVWTFAAPYGELAIADGRLFVAAHDGTLTAISLTSSAKPVSISPTSGPSLGGTPVAISGSGFQTGAVVRIGGIPAVVTSVASNLINAITGPHVNGLVDVEVENPDGDVGRIRNGFTYVCGGTAPTASVSGSGTVCIGESATLSAALTGSGPWNLVWSDGFFQNGIATSPATRDVTPGATTTYTLRTVTAGLCAGTASGSATITVWSTSNATLTAPARVCVGTNATASIPATTGALYNWTVTNGTIVSGQGTNVLSFVGTTNPVTVSVIATIGSCSATASRDLPVSLPPSATVTSGWSVCAGETALVSFVLHGVPPFTVRWSDGVVQSVGAAGPETRTVSPATSTIYAISSLTDAYGCAGGRASGSAPVIVNPVPSASISAPGSYCAGAADVAASVPDAGGGATYESTIAGGTIAGSTSGRSVTFTPTGAAVTLGVTVTLPSGCRASSTRVSSLAPAPSATVSGGGTICAGNAATVQAALSGTAPFTLTWSDGFVQSGIATTLATRSVSPATTTTYTVTAVRDGSCSGSASGSAAVTVFESPRAVVSTPSVLICLGGSATITAQLSGPGPYTLTWSDGVVETVAGPASTRTVTPYLTETYSVVTVSNGTCTVPGTGSTRVVVFPDASAATITAPAEVCAGSGGHVASVPAAGDGTTWVWTATNGTIDSGQGTRSVVFSAGASGDTTLSVTVHAAGGCEVSGSLRVRTAARPPLPAIQAPASLESGEAGAVAEVAGAEGLTCAWTISNGTITDGADTCRITFSAGDPGLVVLGVVTRNAKGCASAPGQVEVPVRGLSSVLTAPIVLDVAGPGGSRYATELTLANPSPSAVKATLLYTPATSLGARGGGTVSETLEGGRQRIVPDLLAWLRTKGLEIPSDGSSQGGTLRVTFENVAAGWSPSASTRTTVASGAGRAGLSMTAVDPAVANASKVWLFGLRENAADRSHVALANLGETGSLDLRVTLHSGEGAAVPKHVLPVVRLEAGQWLQLNSVLHEAGFTAGYALVERIAGSAPFHAYAVFNDNTTHDGSVVPATPAAGLGGTRLVPVVVETGSFTTELVLANPSARAVKARLWFIESLANPGGYSLGGVTVDLAAGEQKVLPNVVSAMRQLGLVVTPAKRDYAGTLAVTFSAAGEPAEGWAGARTATAGAGPGRYGLFCPAPAPDAAPGEAWIFGLIQDASNRSNLALLNAAANLGPVTLRYSVFDGATGRKVATSDPVTLGAGAWMQINGALSKWKVAQGYVKVERIEGTAPFLAYAVVNDGGVPGAGTGDGSYVEMIPIVR